jgi:methionyl-tRNA synthetase
VLDGTLYRAADALRITAALVDPVMPQAAERIRGMLGIRQEQWQGLRPGTLTSGTRLGETAPLFPRIEKTVEELRGMTSQDNSAAPAPVQDTRISIEDFMKVELRVAKVLEAEAVPKSKKLLKLKVDTGADQRTIVAGIAEAYQPEQLVGRTIVIVANLQPAKLMGVESNGMVLAASPEGGAPILVTIDPPLAPGARVR